MFDLTEKTALVTGAASGIGAQIARVLTGAGAWVFLADIDETGARETAAHIGMDGGQSSFLALDVAREADWSAVAARIFEQAQRLHILVNNAGIGHVGTILQTGGEDLDRLYQVNMRGVFNGCKQFVPHLIEQGGGSVINMASVGGVVGVRDRMAYCATKFAVVGLTKSLALDHATQNVRVNCICPGRVHTPFVEARLREYSDPERAYREMSQSQPLGRMARADKIAAAALYLASDEATFITGAALMIDGGFSAGR